MRRAVLFVVLAACGRVGFDHSPSGDDDDSGSTGDHPLHEYPLQSNYDDLYGGPALTPHGGSFIGNRYQFGKNQGLSVDGAMPRDVYTLDMMLSFDTLDDWNKIVDYEDLGPDSGLYSYKSGLQYVIIPGSDFLTTEPRFVLGSARRVTTTRDASGTVNAYIDGVITFGQRGGDPDPPATQPTTPLTFVDTMSIAALSTDRVWFFMDDTSTSTEASAGTVERIRMWDYAMTQQQIAETR